MVDQNVLEQETYNYTAQRVLTVHIADKSLEIRSEPTAPITIATRDTFPPEPPKGLISAPGTIGASTGQTGPHRTIDLAWEPNTEIDLAGYFIYRTDFEVGKPYTDKPIRLTATPIPGPAYRDIDVTSGHRYIYRVTAVDHNGNESGPSASVEDAPDGR